jgi:hypothetical protein
LSRGFFIHGPGQGHRAIENLQDFFLIPLHLIQVTNDDLAIFLPKGLPQGIGLHGSKKGEDNLVFAQQMAQNQLIEGFERRAKGEKSRGRVPIPMAGKTQISF